MNTEVFIIITSLFTGGAERQAIWLANNLLQKGYKVNLLVLKKGDELSHLLLDGVKVYRFQIYSVEYKRRFKLLKILRLAFLSIKKTRRIIRESEKQNQIVVSFLYHSYIAGFFSVLFNKSARLIFSIRSDRLGKRDSKKSNLRHYIFRSMLFRVDKVVFNSLHGLENFIGDIKYKNKSLFITNGLFKINKLTDDVTAKKISNILHGSNTNFVVSARIDPLNNFENLIKAFDQLKNKTKTFKCIIFGRGRDYEKIEKLIKSLNLENNIYLFGNISNASSYFHFFDALVHPAFHAGFSNSVIEAIQSDINVIVGNIGDTTNLFEKNQLILSSFSAVSIYKCLSFYIDMSEEQKNNNIEISKEKFNKLFNNKKTINDWISLIE